MCEKKLRAMRSLGTSGVLALTLILYLSPPTPNPPVAVQVYPSLVLLCCTPIPAPHPPAGLLPVRLQGVFKSHRQVGSPPPHVPPPPAPGLIPLQAVRLQSESGRSRPPWVLRGVLGIAGLRREGIIGSSPIDSSPLCTRRFDLCHIDRGRSFAEGRARTAAAAATATVVLLFPQMRTAVAAAVA